jgi:hypothetical protein
VLLSSSLVGHSWTLNMTEKCTQSDTNDFIEM